MEDINNESNPAMIQPSTDSIEIYRPPRITDIPTAIM
jgi:hypothetical protein